MQKIGDMILYGGSYVHETASKEKKIVRFEPATKYLLLTVTNVIFDDGSKLEIPAAEAETRRYFLNQEPRFEAERHTPFRSYLPGDTIVNARFDAGDLIVVNKMAYHFRKPERGEVFVFDTRGIEGIANKGSSTGQEGGTHYVKRLCGIPGDTLSIQDSQLIVNGKPATERTIQRVASGKPPTSPAATWPFPPPEPAGRQSLHHGRGTVHLSNDSKRPYLHEYAALGDNSTRENSFDSRYWGPVRQYNIVGPASFCLWPFTSHWGLIP
ncbi:signal peptidase I [Akkermansia muciniphila]|nr:signal peptidase I [Akkermansia muciniphila]